MDALSTPFLQRNCCPCCNAPLAASRVKATSNPPAESLSAARHGRFLSGYTSKRVFFTYVECETCSALYCPIYYTDAQLNLLYSRQQENMADVPLEARRGTQEAYARLVMKYSRGRGDFLELGADIGLFAEACSRAGKFNRFWLYEPNVDVHEQLMARLRGHDIVIRTGQFSSADLPSNSVSTAAIIQALDHLLDPIGALREIHRVLEPGGVLLIVTHDCHSFLARLLGRRWPPFTLQHPQLFSPRAMEALLAVAQFECTTIEKTINYFPVGHIARAALNILGIDAPRMSAWRSPLVGLRLGNMGIVARKRT